MFLFPGVCAKTGGTSLVNSKANICSAYRSIVIDYASYIRSISSDNEALAEIFGKSIRVAFHDAAEFSLLGDDTNGPDGCLSTSADNAGLIELNSLVNTLLEPMWQKHCDKIGRADFWALIAKIAIETADITNHIRVPYQYGRRDATKLCTDLRRLPNAQRGLSSIKQVFVDRMGLTIKIQLFFCCSHTDWGTHHWPRAHRELWIWLDKQNNSHAECVGQNSSHLRQ